MQLFPIACCVVHCTHGMCVWLLADRCKLEGEVKEDRQEDGIGVILLTDFFGGEERDSWAGCGWRTGCWLRGGSADGGTVSDGGEGADGVGLWIGFGLLAGS